MPKTINHEKCLDKIRKELMGGKEKVTSIYFDLSNIKDWNKPLNKQHFKTGQRITYEYIHTKRDGTEIKKTKNSFVGHDFCPFCGKPY